MNFSKETLWHFTCEFCKGWWSIATSDEWNPSDRIPFDKPLYCPNCGKDQKTDEDIGYIGIM